MWNSGQKKQSLVREGSSHSGPRALSDGIRVAEADAQFTGRVAPGNDFMARVILAMNRRFLAADHAAASPIRIRALVALRVTHAAHSGTRVARVADR